MCYKILRADGQSACCTTVWYLTLSEIADTEQGKLRTDYDTYITNRLGTAATIGDFDTSDLRPKCVYYEDPKTATHEGSPHEILPRPESG